MTDQPIPEEVLNAPVTFWTCLNRAHETVTWDGDVASCDTCGLTSQMTQRRAALIRADERRKVAEEIAVAIEAVDWVEWALAGQHAGRDAARIARQIGGRRG